jgi:hypothetical protein
MSLITDIQGVVIRASPTTIYVGRGGKLTTNLDIPIGSKVCLIINRGGEITKIIPLEEAKRIIETFDNPILSRLEAIELPDEEDNYGEYESNAVDYWDLIRGSFDPSTSSR